VWLALPVSAIATVVSWLHSRGLPTFEVTVSGPTAATVLTALAMAPGLMALGVGARGLWSWFKAHRLPNSWALPLGIAAAGLLTGAASLWLARPYAEMGRTAESALLIEELERTASPALQQLEGYTARLALAVASGDYPAARALLPGLLHRERRSQLRRYYSRLVLPTLGLIAKF